MYSHNTAVGVPFVQCVYACLSVCVRGCAVTTVSADCNATMCAYVYACPLCMVTHICKTQDNKDNTVRAYMVAHICKTHKTTVCVYICKTQGNSVRMCTVAKTQDNKDNSVRVLARVVG